MHCLWDKSWFNQSNVCLLNRPCKLQHESCVSTCLCSGFDLVYWLIPLSHWCWVQCFNIYFGILVCRCRLKYSLCRFSSQVKVENFNLVSGFWSPDDTVNPDQPTWNWLSRVVVHVLIFISWHFVERMEFSLHSSSFKRVRESIVDTIQN